MGLKRLFSFEVLMYSLLHFPIWFQHFVIIAVVNHYFLLQVSLLFIHFFGKMYLEKKFSLAVIHVSLLYIWQFPGELNLYNPRKASAVLLH